MGACNEYCPDYNKNWTSTHSSYVDETAMFRFVTSQTLMKLHQYLDGFDILLTTTPLLRFVVFCAINITLIPMKMKP